MAVRKPHFSGVATKANIQCSDGRTIMPDAFAHQDKMKVPFVWSHQHNDVKNTLGHAILTKTASGDINTDVYLNGTPEAKHAWEAIQHEDLDSLSIWANKLVERGKQVFHGAIREVSLVLAGANPEAKITNINVELAHGEFEVIEDQAIITIGEKIVMHAHSFEMDDEENLEHEENGEITVDEAKAVYDAWSAKEKDVVHALIGAAQEAAAGSLGHSDEETDEQKAAREKAEAEAAAAGKTPEELEAEKQAAAATSNTNEGDNVAHQEGSKMKNRRNVFEGAGKDGADVHLSHDQMQTIVNDMVNGTYNTLSESFLGHATEYGIENIDFLFPDAKAIQDTPEFVSRKAEWVKVFLNGTRKVPFSRIKSLSADITHDEARARGYIKGNMKKEEWFALAKRETTPTTIYKKQKLDRDDIIDVTTINVVAWLKAEMLVMLDEETARAGLIGDSRPVEDPANPGEPNPDKIPEDKIRPIATDDDFYTVKVTVPANVSPESAIESILRSRKQYRGAGNPLMFTTEDFLTDLLLEKDRMGRRLYPTIADLQVAMRVSGVETVEVMEGFMFEGQELLAVMLNLSDYTFGADRMGQTTMFEDFDIDFNQEKYLIERRQSGALTKFHSAIAIYRAAGTEVVIDGDFVPAFNETTGVVTIPANTGIEYVNDQTDEVLTAGAQPALAKGSSLYVDARPADGYYLPHNVASAWDFTRPKD